MVHETLENDQSLFAPTLQLPVEAKASQLSKPCDPLELGFESTDDLPDLQDVIGQPRAIRALELGCEVSGPGYNIFVLGQPGSGRTTLSTEYLQRKASNQHPPDDWCYINNFEQPHKPKALHLPAGGGVQLKKDLETIVAIAERDLPRAYESEEFTSARDRIIDELKKSQETEFIRLQEYVEKFKFAIVRTAFGIVLVPAIEGKPLTAEEIQNLSPEQRTKLEELQQKLGEEVEKSLRRLRDFAYSASKQLDELSIRTALFLIEPLFDELKNQLTELPEIIHHLEAVQADMVANAARLKPGEQAEQSSGFEHNWKDRYAVNVIVDNSKTTGIPVILETQPAYYNLFGRVEHIVIMGATHTDFNMIRAGALHRANGGYLILSARDLLISPYGWEGLKRVLRDGCIRIIDLGSQLGLLSTETLEPEPIPLNLKIILIGTPLVYYLLRQYDDDFAKLFKVRAEFNSTIERTPDMESEYGLFVKSVVVDNQLAPFERSAVARIIEYSSRLADDQNKLSTRFGKITDLIRESAYWSSKSNPGNSPNAMVTASDVQRAIDESIYRNNLIEERIQELILDDTIQIEVESRAVGQVNALSVYLLGDYTFGRPSRVTAAAYPGRAGIIDIERSARLSGPIHTKGVLIITGFLGNKYSKVGPLTLTASLTFEQSYDEIEGDSASAAELYCLLSAIAGIPLRQEIAVTGSINQHGHIQAIGGVNEKIEGFYTTCKMKGLSGNQGVIIPKTNLHHLMLNAEVIQAVSQGRFHIWPIDHFDEGIAILTGFPAGVLQPDNKFTQGSFNEAVANQLIAFAKASETHPNHSQSSRYPDEEDHLE